MYYIQKKQHLFHDESFEVCYPQRNPLSVKKFKAKTGKIHQVSQDIRHLREIP